MTRSTTFYDREEEGLLDESLVNQSDDEKTMPTHWPKQSDDLFRRLSEEENFEDIEINKSEKPYVRNRRGSWAEMIGIPARLEGTDLAQNRRGSWASRFGFTYHTELDTHHSTHTGGEEFMPSDDDSVSTITSCNTLIHMMQNALDDDWWKARAEAWEESNAEPIKPVLQTQEDKQELKKNRRRMLLISRGGCFGVASRKIARVPRKYKVLWIVFFILAIIGTIVLTSTNVGESIVRSVTEAVMHTKEKFAHGTEGKKRIEAVDNYMDEGND